MLETGPCIFPLLFGSWIPVVCTPILAGQLGWTYEKEALVAGTAEDFAREICRLYQAGIVICS